jgi:hypothetical protein
MMIWSRHEAIASLIASLIRPVCCLVLLLPIFSVKQWSLQWTQQHEGRISQVRCKVLAAAAAAMI